VAELGAQERREREAVYGGWRRCETLEDVEEQERLVDQSDAEIACELLKTVRRTIGHHGGP
jgi:hypothetical protein